MPKCQRHNPIVINHSINTSIDDNAMFHVSTHIVHFTLNRHAELVSASIQFSTHAISDNWKDPEINSG